MVLTLSRARIRTFISASKCKSAINPFTTLSEHNGLPTAEILLFSSNVAVVVADITSEHAPSNKRHRKEICAIFFVIKCIRFAGAAIKLHAHIFHVHVHRPYQFIKSHSFRVLFGFVYRIAHFESSENYAWIMLYFALITAPCWLCQPLKSYNDQQ